MSRALALLGLLLAAPLVRITAQNSAVVLRDEVMPRVTHVELSSEVEAAHYDPSSCSLRFLISEWEHPLIFDPVVPGCLAERFRGFEVPLGKILPDSIRVSQVISFETEGLEVRRVSWLRGCPIAPAWFLDRVEREERRQGSLTVTVPDAHLSRFYAALELEVRRCGGKSPLEPH